MTKPEGGEENEWLWGKRKLFVLKVRERHIKSTIQSHENAENLGAKLQSSHIHMMSEAPQEARTA